MKNRELNFRAWNGKKMLNNIVPIGKNTAIVDIQGFPKNMQSYGEVVESFMQYTNRDLGNDKLYDGDILAHKTEVDGEIVDAYCPICWDHKYNQWAVDWSYKKDGTYLTPLQQELDENNCWLAGNIYENGELLNRNPLWDVLVLRSKV